MSRMLLTLLVYSTERLGRGRGYTALASFIQHCLRPRRALGGRVLKYVRGYIHVSTKDMSNFGVEDKEQTLKRLSALYEFRGQLSAVDRKWGYYC